MQLRFKKLHDSATIPEYQTSGSAGFDLHAVIDPVIEKSYNIHSEENWPTIEIYPGKQFVVKTQLSCAIPEGYEMQIRPRSGMAFKHKITVTNSPGTIDSDYRGEIMIMLYNLGDAPFEIKNGDRIAQGVISKVPQPEIVEVEELDETDRGVGGFGSTGA